MPQLPEPQKGSEIKNLISQFKLLEKGEKIYFDETNFLELIDHYIMQNKHQKAFAVLSKAFSFYPESYEILLSEAQLLIETGLNLAASKKLKKLYKLKPKDMGLIMLIGINYTNLAVINKAMMFFDKALSMIKNKNKELLLYSIAQTFIQAGRYDVAAFYLTKAYQISPKDKTIILDLAFCLERNQNYKKSEKLYKAYLKKDPFSKLAWYNLGVVLTSLQKVDQAIEAFDYSIAIDQKFSSPVYNKADLFFQTKKYDKSIEEFSKLLELEKSNATALFLRGVSYFNTANLKSALIDLKRSLKIQTNNPEAWFYVAKIHFLSKNYKKAKKALFFALDVDKINAQYWKLSADIFLKEKNYKFANKAFLQAIASDPFIENLWFEYADFKTKLNDYHEALSILSKGKEFITDNLTYLLKLSSLYLLLNDKNKAKQVFKNANLICDNALEKIESFHPDKKQISILIEN
ncbi:MAG: tetratricopeptide repeat protein [Bacteroidales bacterium]|nr:tetratricopeptide repeat protein [Bacteroidales bacterium]